MSRRIAYFLVLAAAALLLFVRSGSVPLLDPDESRFARTSVEMMRSGDLVVPHFEGEPRLVKPPLVHWIQSWLFRQVGPTEWAARFHAAGATLGSILLLGWLVRRRFGPEGRLWSAAVFATMPLVLVPGRLGTLDALLAVHVLAVVALDMAEQPEEGGSYRSIGIGALLGLAFLIKGPVGVVLPLLIMLAGRTATRRQVLPSAAAALQGVAAWAAVVLPWGLVFLRRIGWHVGLDTLRGEALERYFAGTAHAEPPWFYLIVGALGCLPWLAPLVIGLGRVWRLRRDPQASTALYAAAGLIAGLVFFSLSPSKVASYLLPLAPLAAVLVTWELGREIEAPQERTLGPTLLAGTLAGAAVLLAVAGAQRLEGSARLTALAGAVLLGVGGLVAAVGAVRRRPRWTYAAAAGSTGAFLLVVVLVLLPSVAESKSAAGLIDAVPALSHRRPILTVEVRVPSLTFYLNRVPEVLTMEELEPRLAEDDRPLVVLVDVDLPTAPAAAMARLREIGRRGKYRVFEEVDANATN